MTYNIYVHILERKRMVHINNHVKHIFLQALKKILVIFIAQTIHNAFKLSRKHSCLLCRTSPELSLTENLRDSMKNVL